MQMMNQVERLAGLLGKLSIFRSASFRDYRVFIGVPAHCLGVKGCDIRKDFPNHVIDLLICRGDEAIQAVVFDKEYRDMEKLFSTHLQALPCEYLKSEELTDASARELCGEIEFRLRCDKSGPEHTGCMLRRVLLRFALGELNEEELAREMKTGYKALLEKKHLIDTRGTVTPYGHACGIFCRLLIGGGCEYFTVPRAAQELGNAVLWRDGACLGKSLSQRLSRLNQGLPSECADRDKKLLKQLLSTPLEELFRRYPQDGQRLNVLLSQAQFLSRESAISAFGEKEDIETYADVLYAVRNLWEYTAHRDCRNMEAAGLCEQLLAFLSFPLWSIPTEDRALQMEGANEPRGLRVQLEHVRGEVFDNALAAMQLSHFFYAAACLSESQYPLWLYRTCVQPWLSYYVSGELSFAKAMQVVYGLSQSNDENENVDYFPLIYDILVESISGTF